MLRWIRGSSVAVRGYGGVAGLLAKANASKTKFTLELLELLETNKGLRGHIPDSQFTTPDPGKKLGDSGDIYSHLTPVETLANFKPEGLDGCFPRFAIPGGFDANQIKLPGGGKVALMAGPGKYNWDAFLRYLGQIHKSESEDNKRHSIFVQPEGGDPNAHGAWSHNVFRENGSYGVKLNGTIEKTEGDRAYHITLNVNASKDSYGCTSEIGLVDARGELISFTVEIINANDHKLIANPIAVHRFLAGKIPASIGCNAGQTRSPMLLLAKFLVEKYRDKEFTQENIFTKDLEEDVREGLAGIKGTARMFEDLMAGKMPAEIVRRRIWGLEKLSHLIWADIAARVTIAKERGDLYPNARPGATSPGALTYLAVNEAIKRLDTNIQTVSHSREVMESYLAARKELLGFQNEIKEKEFIDSFERFAARKTGEVVGSLAGKAKNSSKKQPSRGTSEGPQSSGLTPKDTSLLVSQGRSFPGTFYGKLGPDVCGFHHCTVWVWGLIQTLPEECQESLRESEEMQKILEVLAGTVVDYKGKTVAEGLTADGQRYNELFAHAGQGLNVFSPEVCCGGTPISLEDSQRLRDSLGNGGLHPTSESTLAPLLLPPELIYTNGCPDYWAGSKSLDEKKNIVRKCISSLWGYAQDIEASASAFSENMPQEKGRVAGLGR